MSRIAGYAWVRSVVAFVAVAGGGAAFVACRPPTFVSLLRAAGIPNTAAPPLPSSLPLEVVTRGTGVPDPLPVRGTRFVYGELETALAHAVASAAAPWAEAHRNARPDGYQLFVELVRADALAEDHGARVLVTLGVRATLRARKGNHYLGQTQAFCRDGAIADGGNAAPVLYACMTRLSRDLAGWLGAIEP